MRACLILALLVLSMGSKSKVVTDRAALKINGVVYLESNLNEVKTLFEKRECLFKESLQYELLKSVKASPLIKTMFQIKLNTYVKEKKFNISEPKLSRFLGERLVLCQVELSKMKNSLKEVLFAELFLQQYLMTAKNPAESKEMFERIYKLVMSKYDHFIYE